MQQQEVKDASCSRAKGEAAYFVAVSGGPRVFIHEGKVKSHLESKKVWYIFLRECGLSGLLFWLLMIEDLSPLTPDGIAHLEKSRMAHIHPSPHASPGKYESPLKTRATCGIVLR